MNIQRSEIDENSLISYYNSKEYQEIINEDKKREQILDNDVDILLKELNNSKKPIILV
ncbi:hypothetical protein J5893_01595 [bacterium]|nr:hypothetical protein [bacterium]